MTEVWRILNSFAEKYFFFFFFSFVLLASKGDLTGLPLHLHVTLRGDIFKVALIC